VFEAELAGEQGIIMTGTLTSLMDGAVLTLNSRQDIAIIGNITTMGENSEIVIQTDGRAYVQGFLKARKGITVRGGDSEENQAFAQGGAKGISVVVATTAVLNTFDR
ncbi:hypothetical protein RZS08_60900, partial [Arthrospira platensis SPKY1]|nr:hypothetical protein [Arthrospira platensis SPKY1]